MRGFPSWVLIIFLFAFLGPAMRGIFGGRSSRRDRLRDRELAGQLEGSLAERDAVIEDLQHRISELESRLDFAERLLAERKEPPVIPSRT